MESTTAPRAYSADVRLHLEVNGSVFSLAQTGPDHVVVREPVDLSPCEADVVMDVDGQVQRWHVLLVDGISKDNHHVKTVPAG